MNSLQYSGFGWVCSSDVVRLDLPIMIKTNQSLCESTCSVYPRRPFFVDLKNYLFYMFCGINDKSFYCAIIIHVIVWLILIVQLLCLTIYLNQSRTHDRHLTITDQSVETACTNQLTDHYDLDRPPDFHSIGNSGAAATQTTPDDIHTYKHR